MSLRSLNGCMLSLGLMLTTAASAWAADAKPGANLATYAKPSGETYFALSLAPQGGTPRAKTTDVVVLFDTSASQPGLYRDDALASLKAMLSELGESARVKLVAVDVNAVPMTNDFVAVDSAAMQEGLQKLERRAPLGSTDMAVAMQQAAKDFAAAGTNPRSVVYIGDGISRANLLGSDEFGGLVNQLVDSRVSVSSFAIGPQRDLILLAALANQTGGNVFLDGNNVSPQQAGGAMAAIATETVIWPTAAQMPKAFSESYPAALPPLRGDRTSVVVGMLDGAGSQQIQVTGVANGQPVDMTWNVAPQASSDDDSYLPQLVEMARADRGLTLPTIGTEGLAAARQAVLGGARTLAELSGRALASGDSAGAARLAKAALGIDPASTAAENVRGAAGQFGGEDTVRLANFQPGLGGVDAGSALDEFVADNGAFLNEVQNQARIQSEIIQAEVTQGLTRARELFDVDPQGAIADLKQLLDNVERAPDLEAEIRAQLRDQLVSAIKEAQRRQIEKDQRDQQRAEQEAAARERSRLIREAERRDEKIKQIVARFNSLMDEGRYREAEDAAYEARELAPGSPYLWPTRRLEDNITVNAIHTARMTGYMHDILSVREARQRGVVDALFQVEKAHVPFPDDPPITYPDPQVWEELTLRRKKYASIDLAKRGGAEEKIFEALDQPTTLEFIEAPLSDVIDYTKDLHGIEIQIDKRALEDVGIGTDTPITRNLKGITLRSALRLLLKDLDLTYVIRDEVLLITTPEEAESQLVTKVYPVADLVLPIRSGAGANPFQLGGGLGGQGGFGGGLGGGGGGLGGGG
ncbi:MAG: hypothetical protein KDA41_11165, partial [Planctomycetales bacterium]|nr:hypothetical protein [Planctomycetales bacterium]